MTGWDIIGGCIKAIGTACVLSGVFFPFGMFGVLDVVGTTETMARVALVAYGSVCWMAAFVIHKNLARSSYHQTTTCPGCGSPVSQSECDNCGARFDF